MKEKITKIFKEVMSNMEKDHISEYSAQCSYYTILSFIPFVILLITLIQYTNIEQQTLFDAISKIIPATMSGFVLDIVREVYSKSIFVLWSAGKGLYALMKGLYEVFKRDGKKKKSVIYLKLMSLLQTIIFIVIIVLGLTFLVFGDSLISIVKKYFGGFENYTLLSSVVTELTFIFATFIIFLFLYKFMPKNKMTFKSQIPGAIFGAISLNVVSFVFAKYLDIFKGFSITYGSLTTLMLIMMWTYYS